MRLGSARDLKLEIAKDVFAPLVDHLLERALRPRLGTNLPPSPLGRIALGISLGRTSGDFTLAVRLQKRSSALEKVVARIRDRVGPELDVRFVGRVLAQQGSVDAADLQKVCRPVMVGCSVAHVASTAGTLGLIARHRKTGRTVLLSNSHIIAQAGRAHVGDGVTQPGPLDGGGPSEHVAALLDFVPIKMSGSNQVDAAIAVVDESIAVDPSTVPSLGTFSIPEDDAILPGTKVVKVGRTTGLRRGEVTAVELDDIVVDYDVGTVVFDDQIEITGLPDLPFSDQGDSGSLVLDESLRAVGIVFCGQPDANGGQGLTYANRLSRVMSGLDLITL